MEMEKSPQKRSLEKILTKASKRTLSFILTLKSP
jgi:hypothetical protein